MLTTIITIYRPVALDVFVTAVVGSLTEDQKNRIADAHDAIRVQRFDFDSEEDLETGCITFTEVEAGTETEDLAVIDTDHDEPSTYE